MSLSLYPNVFNKNFHIGETPPTYAYPGDQWLNTENGNIFIFIRDDAGKGYWVESGSPLVGG